MKRREEITQTAKNKYPYIKGLPQSTSHQAIFIEAAEWADKTMIEKACQWFINNWREYVYQDGDGIVHFGHWESDFRKAMEE